jgi:hypothetical protein
VACAYGQARVRHDDGAEAANPEGMSVAAPLEFFFFYGSIHSYLSVMRIEAMAARAGVTVRWRPFNLREILIEQNNTGFTRNEVKMNYVWHDVERRAKRHGIPFAGRAPTRICWRCGSGSSPRRKAGAHLIRARRSTIGSSIAVPPVSAITSSASCRR